MKINMKLGKFYVLFLLINILYSQPLEENISFRYGIIGQKEIDMDSLFSISDNSILESGDQIKLNFDFEKGSCFYVVTLSKEGEYGMLYSSSSEDREEVGNIFTSLEWQKLGQANTPELFTLISSKSQLKKLEDLFVKYKNAKKVSKKRFHKRIKLQLESLENFNPDETKEKMVQRLEKPIIGGVTYRGMMEGVLMEQSLTHTSTGEGVAIAQINISVK
jgi:hypothetical protein